ncbi:cyclic pyranopterin monophosphate synthase MoaC [uncultured Aeromicrobium sp.]|uniref:cyclic pyranopterin monophosphate synthase MoaC n=1 Tax=uncultured Aeromicrobium sp. TaxID=337820 RepID=UPI0025E26F40|nr:cyclic pyranopterin monophosphate synthase MoaC [uncultured Aeromicrobium sp.]
MEDRTALSHYRDDGSAHMVDVSGKPPTTRTATASGRLLTRPDVVQQIAEGSLPKGEAMATARIAGILAAKQTSSLIPLCHPLPLSKVEIDLEPSGDQVLITATVRTTAPTGVEMEALTAVSVAGLTLYDMIKAVDRAAVLSRIQVDRKHGGTADWERDDD